MSPAYDLPGGCHGCGRQWSGHSEAHCVDCHEHFTSDSAFDGHRAHPNSDESCFSPESLQRKDGLPRFVEIDRVHGKTWKLNRPDLITDGSWFATLRPNMGVFKKP